MVRRDMYALRRVCSTMLQLMWPQHTGMALCPMHSRFTTALVHLHTETLSSYTLSVVFVRKAGKPEVKSQTTYTGHCYINV